MISLRKLKKLCEVARYGINGGCIPNTTWRKYKRKCEVNAYATYTDENKAIYLLALCHHKKSYPNAEIHIDGIREYLKNNPSKRLELLNQLKEKQLEPQNKLVKLIEEKTGFKISEKTLYRWASKENYLEYQRNKDYTEFEVNIWCDYALKIRNP